MSSTREQRAIFSGRSRKLESDIASKFGVRVNDTIPRKYRPETAELTYPLLAKLFQLAARVPDLASFQYRLSKACERRAENDPDSSEKLSIQASDAVAALRDLEQEEANSQLRTLLKKDRRSSSIGTKQDSLPVKADRKEQEETPLQHRPRLSRPSKSAAGAKIADWTKQLKPTRNSSTTSLQKSASDVSDTAVVHPRASTIPDSEDEQPQSKIRSPLRRSSRHSGAFAADEMARGKKRAISESPKPQRRASVRLRRARESSSSSDSDNDADRTDLTVTKSRTPRGIAGTSVDPEGILPTQREHANLFPDHMPKDQHYKRANPTIIHDPLAIENAETLSYPVEVPALFRGGVNKGRAQKGELWEILNAQEFRDHQADAANLLKRSVPGSSRTPDSIGTSTKHLGSVSSERTTEIEEEETPVLFTETDLQRQMLESSEHVGERGDGSLMARLDVQIQLLGDVMSDASRTAITASENLSLVQKERAVGLAGVLMDDFVRAVKKAQQAYEDGLARLGVSLR
ncbi:hypothetical protein K491DRAFT_277444 [Lophiostoma macrostomum CBS 122681]|uniref:Uncharacterized protein n=1 Tax=Lophiostoma macrostomum CBS 122681 TaxID=1314788 RepID=A0A6A6SLH2_9PLEO|nr:hypothetical protein K491DRAFT_277444 [Lophiostoma macrostomum CBS 122681]